MISGNNRQNVMTKVFIGAVMLLAAVVLILFATGRLDGFFSADDLIYDDNSSQSISDSIDNVNSAGGSGNSSDSVANAGGSDSAGDSESAPESTVESGSSTVSSESVPDSTADPESSTVSSESVPDSTADHESSTVSSESVSDSKPDVSDSKPAAELRFRNTRLLEQHYQKHGIDMGFNSAEEYEKAAAAVPSNPEALHKIEAEDGDDVYYIESTNEFVVVSTDGYLRTYFNPDRGKDYFDRQ